jgi:hypothetical protein
MLGKRSTGIAAALAGIGLLAIAAGCGSGGGASDSGKDAGANEPVTSKSTPPDSGQAQVEPKEKAPDATVAPSHCPPGLPSCRSAEGRIVYLERVDPDGDGDAHFVISDRPGITLPGLTAIDVRKGLRPHPLPGVGELISAAGPVQTGSHGQHQIHALELHVSGR